MFPFTVVSRDHIEAEKAPTSAAVLLIQRYQLDSLWDEGGEWMSEPNFN